MSYNSPLGLSDILSMPTPMPCGTSSFKRFSAFSRIISAHTIRSGISVTMSSGKYIGPGTRYAAMAASSASTPFPLSAEISIICLKQFSFSSLCRAADIASALAMSHLFIAAIIGALASLSFAIIASSRSRMPFAASAMNSAHSTSLSDSYATLSIYSPRRFFGAATPGVSRNTI